MVGIVHRGMQQSPPTHLIKAGNMNECEGLELETAQGFAFLRNLINNCPRQQVFTCIDASQAKG